MVALAHALPDPQVGKLLCRGTSRASRTSPPPPLPSREAVFRTASTTESRPRLPATRKVRQQPYFIHPEDMQVMALASLYEYWRNPEVQPGDEGGRAANRMRSIRQRQSR